MTDRVDGNRTPGVGRGGSNAGAAASSIDQGAACYIPTQEHSCEICGMSGLSDDLMREHTRTCHVEGNAQCPFCGFSGVLPAELLLHVNQAHLDYLTPENELMSFIDDQSPSIEGDSDSISECRGISPTINLSSQHQNHTHQLTNHSNTICAHSLMLSTHKSSIENTISIGGTTPTGTTNVQNSKQLVTSSSISKTNNWLPVIDNSKLANEKPPPPSFSSKPNFHEASSTATVNNKHCDMNGGSSNNTTNNYCNSNKTELVNGFIVDPINGAVGGAGQGSPSRSQLGLKLKSHSPATRKLSPLQCPICPYTSDNANILEEHINRSHFDPLSPSVNHCSVAGGGEGGEASNNHYTSTLNAMQCPICSRVFESASDLELHVNIEHRDILSPGKTNTNDQVYRIGQSGSICPICNISLDSMKSQEVDFHIENHFAKSPKTIKGDTDLEKEAQKLREQREFEMLRAQYGMDDQGNFREQSAAAMQRAVYAGEMSVADYYERQVGLRAAESHGIDDGTSCTKSVSARVLALSSSSPGVIKSLLCSSVDHYASSYGDKGWGCGYRNLQMLLSSLLQNTTFNEAIYSAWGTQGPSRTAMPSISRLQKMVEAAWAQGFDVQGSEQLGCKLYNTRKWIGATEVVTVLSWLRINCQLVDFHRPSSSDGRQPELFNWVFQYFDEPRIHTPPLYLQHQGHSRTIVGIEQRASGLTLLVLDPSHGPRQVAALGSSQDSLRLIRRGPSAMRAPQYQIVAVRGLIETEEQYQASKVLRSLRIPPDR